MSKPIKMLMTEIEKPWKARSNWRTPRAIYQKLNEEFDFDHDPCPPLAKTNGIFSEWGKRNFVNPPYGKPIASWLEKGIIESKKGKLCVFLLPSYTDVAWFHNLVLPYAFEIRFVRGRLSFDERGTAPFASMIVIYK